MPALISTAVENELAESSVPDLLNRAREGDAESFSALCRLHGTRLLRHATGLCGDPTLAEDLAQETLWEAWKSIRRFNGRCRFFTWLCAILLNRYRNVLRRQRPRALSSFERRERLRAESILDNLPDHAPAPDQAKTLAERTAFLRGCIDALSPKHRQVIYLRFYVDDSVDSIAAALDCSAGTIKSRLFHAVERLRAMQRGHEQLDGFIPPPPTP